RATRRQRRRKLPGRHHQRVVPGDDLAHDAHPLLQRVIEQRTADRTRLAADRRDRRGVETEVLDGLVQLCLHRGDGLADVARLELRELLAVRDDRVRERVQQPGALVRRRLPPGTGKRTLGRLYGAVDVGLAGERNRRQWIAGG